MKYVPRILAEQIMPPSWQPFLQQQQQEPPEPQQQQKEPEIKTPFDDIDLDLLDDVNKAKIVEAKTQFATVAKAAAGAATLQAQVDLHKAEIDKIRAQSTNPKSSPPSDKELTLEEEIAAEYRAQGITDEKIIAINSKIQAGILGKYGNRLGAALQPLQNQTLENTAANTFEALRGEDSTTGQRLQIDEVAEAVWAKTQNMIKQGATPSKEIIANFAKIAYMDFKDKNPESVDPTPPTRQVTPPNIQTRHTFPGALHSPSVPKTKSDVGDMDAETAAAVGATTAFWEASGVKVPASMKSNGNKVVITRGN